VIVSRSEANEEQHAWPTVSADALAEYAAIKREAPWLIEAPLLLPAGRIAAEASGRAWWRAHDDAPLQLRAAPPPVALGADISRAAALWDGVRLGMITAQSNWGRIDFDA
jgi:hypothetical protein